MNSGLSSKMTPSCKWPILLAVYISLSLSILTFYLSHPELTTIASELFLE